MAEVRLLCGLRVSGSGPGLEGRFRCWRLLFLLPIAGCVLAGGGSCCKDLVTA